MPTEAELKQELQRLAELKSQLAAMAEIKRIDQQQLTAGFAALPASLRIPEEQIAGAKREIARAAKNTTDDLIDDLDQFIKKLQFSDSSTDERFKTAKNARIMIGELCQLKLTERVAHTQAISPTAMSLTLAGINETYKVGSEQAHQLLTAPRPSAADIEALSTYLNRTNAMHKAYINRELQQHPEKLASVVHKNADEAQHAIAGKKGDNWNALKIGLAVVAVVGIAACFCAHPALGLAVAKAAIEFLPPAGIAIGSIGKSEPQAVADSAADSTPRRRM